MPFKNLLPLLLIFTLLCTCCNNAKNPNNESEKIGVVSEPGDQSKNAPMQTAEGEPQKDISLSAENTQAVNKKKIIKDGTMSVRTTDIRMSKKSLDVTLKKLDAYYELEDLQNNDYKTSYDLKIRIPAENFENMINAIEAGKDEIKGKNIQARDVTEEYIDIQTRLVNKRAYLVKYTQLLSKATSVKDMLEIEENIRALQEEIESAEGRLKYLSDQVAYSTLSINLFMEKEYVYKPQQEDKFTERIKKALGSGWSGFVDFTVILVNIWPGLLLIILLILMGKRYIRKNKNKGISK